eukprot:1563602-Ditylum_brightwellii.AAC.1
MLAAEKKCHKATAGHAWSLQLAKAARKAQYWKIRLYLERNGLLHTDYLRKLERSLDITHQPTSITELQSRLRLAKKELIDAQKRSDILRDNNLEELAKRENPGSPNVQTIVKHICHQEEIKTSFAQMRPITKGVTGGTILILDIPVDPVTCPSMHSEVAQTLDLQPTWKTLYDNDNIIEVLIRRNSLHLHQSFDTPFAEGPLKEYIGESGLGQGADDILNGRFDPNKLENMPAVNYWLWHHIC